MEKFSIKFFLDNDPIGLYPIANKETFLWHEYIIKSIVATNQEYSFIVLSYLYPNKYGIITIDESSQVQYLNNLINITVKNESNIKFFEFNKNIDTEEGKLSLVDIYKSIKEKYNSF